MSESKEEFEYFRFKDVEEFNIAISKVKKDNSIANRSLGGSKKHSYFPISSKQARADYVFRVWHVVSEDYQKINNEILCTIKILALPDYPGADHIAFTGSAAKPITADKNSKVDEVDSKKKTNSLEYCIPAVRSEAIGSALQTLGNFFGRNLGRSCDDNYGYDLTYNKGDEVNRESE